MYQKAGRKGRSRDDKIRSSHLTRGSLVQPMGLLSAVLSNWKKKHPCGSQEWLVLRVGMDFKMRCQGCGHEVMLPRSKVEKNIRKVLREGQPVDNL